jgi:spermidine synthase
MAETHSEPLDQDLSAPQLVILLLSILLVALCGIAYELIIGTVSSYLLGNSVYQFSITIGLFMFAMGVGAYVSKLFIKGLLAAFVGIEIAISLVGGVCSLVLFLVFPYYYFYKPVMYTLIIVIGALVGLEIPILTRIISRTQSLRLSIAHVLSLDYLGALIGSVAFPLLFLPHLGLFRSSFVIGLINIFVAFVNVYAFRNNLKRPLLVGLLSAAIAAGLVGFTVAASYITGYAESRLFVDDVVYRHHSPYQRIILTQSSRTGELRLYLDGHLQFGEKDEYRYHEALVHPVMSVPGPRERVLILGGGDGMVAREVLKYGNVQQIDLVDLDAAVTDLCSTFPAIRRINGDSLRDPRVIIHNLDAFVFVRETRDKFHRVIIDLPDPHNESLSKLYAVEFYRILARRLAEGGLVVTQSSSPFFAREVYWCITRTLEAAGFSTYSYHVAVPAFGVWGFNLAAFGKPPPRSFTISVPTRYLTDEAISAAGVFGRDICRLDGPINSVFEPKLYQLYLKAVER